MLLSYLRPKLLTFLLVCGAMSLQAQSIVVNDPGDPESSFTPEQLLSNVLVDGCSTIQFDFLQENPDGVSDLTSRSWGYFRRTSTNFPFEEGVILSSGFGTSAQGPNNDPGVSDDSVTGIWAGDADLKAILDDFNGDVEDTNNATVFEFRFTPATDMVTFDFIFASEEYEDQFECDSTFRDGFAFLIRGPGIPDDSGTAFGGTNIALVPGLTNVPVSTGTIHLPGITGGGTDCAGQVDGVDFRSDLYISNSGANNTDVVQFDGYTDVLTAQSTVQAGQEYTMKLVISDRGDTAFDSAVFLRASSLNLGGADLGVDIDVCDVSATITEIGGPYSGAETYEWFFPDLSTPIPGETSNSITVNQSGTYHVIVTDGTCQYTDSIEVNLQGGVDAGEDATAEYCPTGPAFNLFDQLGGTPDPGGSWTGPSGLTNADLGTFTPGTNVAGIYTYTATITNNGQTCTDTAEVTVTEVGTPNFTVVANDPTSCGADDGSLVIEGLLANTPYTITYTDDGTVIGPASITSDGNGNVIISGLDPGTYSDIVVDGGGCIGNDPGPWILVEPPFIPQFEAFGNTSCTLPNGRFVISALGINKDYELTYTLDGVVNGLVVMTSDANGEIVFGFFDTATFEDITITCVADNSCTAFDAGPFIIFDQTNFVEDFGAGIGRVSTPFTNYLFNGATQVDGGQYAINNNASDLNTGWHNMEDHTAGDTNGRMFVVNGETFVGEFYRRTIPVIQNADYDFSAWITTVYDIDTGICGGTGDPSNVTFRVESTLGVVLNQVNTGDIQNESNPNWQEFTLSFNSGNNSEIQLVLLNNAVGVCGNDLAIDDISLVANNIPLFPTVSIVQPDCIGGGNIGGLLIGALDPNTTYDLTYDQDGTPVGPISITTDANGDYMLSGLPVGLYENLVVTLAGCGASAPLGPFNITQSALSLNLTVEEPTACYVLDGRFVFSGLVSGESYSIGYSQDGTVVAPQSYVADTNGQVIIDGLGTGTYTDFTIEIGACSDSSFDVYEFPGCSIIPEGISPNNDGINDSFEVSWLQATHIKIFNRYGTEVYELPNYRNEWYGTTNDGQELPVGTYFYVIEVPVGDPISGWVYVNREAQ